MNEISHDQVYRLDVPNPSSWIASTYAETGLPWENHGMSSDFDFKPVRDTLARVIQDKGVAPTTLSLKVGKSKSLVKDILDDGKDIKLSTLTKLAGALEVDVGDLLPASILGQRQMAPALSADELEPLLDALIPLAPPGPMKESSRRALSAALAYGLELLHGDRASPASGDAVAVAARAAASRFRDLMN